MKIVIDIPEDVYTRLFNNGTETSFEDRKVIDTAIRLGTPLPKGYDSIKMVTNAEEAKEYPISEDILKGFEEFTKMMFKQGQAESEDKE